MIRILIGLLFTALLGVAFAGPPIDFEVTCGEGEGAPLVGVLSLVEGRAHLALLPDVACEDGFVVVAVGDSELDVELAWDADTQAWSVVVDGTPVEDAVKVVTVPSEAVEGMLAAHRQRTAAFERAASERAVDARERAQERAREESGELDRDRDRDCEPDCGDGNPDAPGPPDGLPPAENPDPPVEVPGPSLQGPGHGRP